MTDPYPVVYSAVIDQADVLISGDKDITAVKIETPELLTIAEFMEKYGSLGKNNIRHGE